MKSLFTLPLAFGLVSAGILSPIGDKPAVTLTKAHTTMVLPVKTVIVHATTLPGGHVNPILNKRVGIGADRQAKNEAEMAAMFIERASKTKRAVITPRQNEGKNDGAAKKSTTIIVHFAEGAKTKRAESMKTPTTTATIDYGIPTNRPVLAQPNICNNECDVYYVNCVNACLPTDTVDNCKKTCFSNTCWNGFMGGCAPCAYKTDVCGVDTPV